MFGPFCASTSVNWVLDASGDELSLPRGGQLGRITVSFGCATPISEGFKFPVSRGQVHEQKYSHNSYVKWYYRGSLLRSEASRLAQADSKAGLEMASLSEITNWEVEKMPLGFKAVPLPGVVIPSFSVPHERLRCSVLCFHRKPEASVLSSHCWNISLTRVFHVTHSKIWAVLQSSYIKGQFSFFFS